MLARVPERRSMQGTEEWPMAHAEKTKWPCLAQVLSRGRKPAGISDGNSGIIEKLHETG